MDAYSGVANLPVMQMPAQAAGSAPLIVPAPLPPQAPSPAYGAGQATGEAIGRGLSAIGGAIAVPWQIAKAVGGAGLDFAKGVLAPAGDFASGVAQGAGLAKAPPVDPQHPAVSAVIGKGPDTPGIRQVAAGYLNSHPDVEPQIQTGMVAPAAPPKTRAQIDQEYLSKVRGMTYQQMDRLMAMRPIYPALEVAKRQALQDINQVTQQQLLASGLVTRHPQTGQTMPTDPATWTPKQLEAYTNITNRHIANIIGLGQPPSVFTPATAGAMGTQ